MLDFLFCSPVENFLTLKQNDPSLSCSLMSKTSAFVLDEQLFYEDRRFL